MSGGDDTLLLHMELKHKGIVKHKFECYGPSLKTGRHKLAIGILQQMYGKDKKWRDLMIEMEEAIIKARNERGAGPKPVIQKYDPNYKVPEQEPETQPDAIEID